MIFQNTLDYQPNRQKNQTNTNTPNATQRQTVLAVGRHLTEVSHDRTHARLPYSRTWTVSFAFPTLFEEGAALGIYINAHRLMRDTGARLCAGRSCRYRRAVE